MSTVLCTLGMHRSGTSMVSRMLRLLGVSLGNDPSLADAGSDNPKGYWEHAGFKQLNEQLLHRFEGAWNRPPVFPPSWTDDAWVQELAGRARQLVRNEFADAPFWSWKDPRTCLTLPFWQAVVGPMRYIICLRDPRDIAASLRQRNGLAPADVELLWLAHIESALRHTTGQPRLFVHFDAMLADPLAALHRIARFAGLTPAPDDDHRLARELRAFIDPSLRHHHAPAGTLVHDTQCSFATRSLFLALEDAVCSDAGVAGTRLAALATAARDAGALHAAMAAETATVRAQAAALALANATLQAQVTQLETRCDEYERENQMVRRTLGDVHTSSAWRLIMAWRRATTALLPPGSRRQAAVATVVGRIADVRGPAPAHGVEHEGGGPKEQ